MLYRRLAENDDSEDLDEHWHSARLRNEPEVLKVTLLTGPGSDQERVFKKTLGGDDAAELEQIARHFPELGFELRGCFNCVRYGADGRCGLVSPSGQGATLPAHHACREHRLVAGWPDNPGLATETRANLARLDAYPSRSDVFEGALVGLALGRHLSSAKDDLDLALFDMWNEALSDPKRPLPSAEEVVRWSKLENAAALITCAVPLGLSSPRKPDALVAALRPSGVAGSDLAESMLAAALLVSLAVAKLPADEMEQDLWAYCAPFSKGLRICLDTPSRAFSEILKTEGARARWSVEKVVVAGLRAFAETPEDPTEALRAALATPQNPLAVAGFTGALCGAFNGFDALPDPSRIGAEKVAALRALGNRLWLASVAKEF
jgi:hypothetical protein